MPAPALTTRAQQLLDYLTEKAELGGVCPTLGQIAHQFECGTEAAGAMLKQLRKARQISWRLVGGSGGMGVARIVRITATGQETAPPAASRRPGKRNKAKPLPAFTPTDQGCPVRRLVGPEFEYWKSVYEAREASQRGRAGAAA